MHSSIISANAVSEKCINYDSVKEDSELQINYIDKYIKVNLIKNISYTGFVHSIDPVTHSIILSVPETNRYISMIIPGHAILDISEEPSNGLSPPKRKPLQIDTNQDLLKRKNKLMSWFKSNLMPVSELDDKILIGNVSLLPPYNVLDLCTENPIVAMEIKKIMERMPMPEI